MEFGFSFLRLQNVDRLRTRRKKTNFKIYLQRLTYQRCSYKAKWKRCIEWFYAMLCRAVHDAGGVSIMICLKGWKCFINKKVIYISAVNIGWIRAFSLHIYFQWYLHLSAGTQSRMSQPSLEQFFYALYKNAS